MKLATISIVMLITTVIFFGVVNVLMNWAVEDICAKPPYPQVCIERPL
ncbi:hypothetical protein H0W80_00125 [Candidatus Saccharibacteria bacterium]|nr:hypothetical protein [Candidatus Saccharibacteria bacterium]